MIIVMHHGGLSARQAAATIGGQGVYIPFLEGITGASACLDYVPRCHASHPARFGRNSTVLNIA